MHLLKNWKQIVKKAWSFRLAGLAGILSTCEVLLPVFIGSMPRGLFALLSVLTITLAMIARVVAQKEMSSDQD